MQIRTLETMSQPEPENRNSGHIYYQLVPNVKGLEKTLANFAEIIDADEILLFEKATFLVTLIWFLFGKTNDLSNALGDFTFYTQTTSRCQTI